MNAAIRTMSLSLVLVGVLFDSHSISLCAEKDVARSVTTAMLMNRNPQDLCGQQAQEKFSEIAWDKTSLASSTGHYNKRRETCFIEIDQSSTDSIGGVFVSKTLEDAHGREYADFISYTKLDGVTQLLCNVILSSGDQIECRSLFEFEEFTKSITE